MENDNKKILTVSFVVVALLVAFSTGMMIDTFAGSWAVIARMANNDLVHHGVPILLGMVTFACLQFNNKVVQFGDEVVMELRKVVWPSRKDTIAMTIVVCIMLVVSGFLLGIFDFLSSRLVNLLVQ